MDFKLTPEQEAFGQELDAYLRAQITPELVAEKLELGHSAQGPVYRKFIRQMGADGWLGIGWPEEYGGKGKTPLEQHIFFEVCEYHDVLLPVMALNAVGPTLMKFGSEEQKQAILPRTLEGDMEIAIGYTEPEAGSDLLALQMTAVRDGDEYVLNGQKIFTTNAHLADYLWLAARTDPGAKKKHHGISVFLFPMDTPGISIQPMQLMGEGRNNCTYYDNVRVPASALVGEENSGWTYITSQLNLERIALAPSSPIRRNIEEVTQWAKETRLNGTLVIDRPAVRRTLADLTVQVDVLKMLNYQTAWMVTEGMQPFAESSALKAYGTNLAVDAASKLHEILSLYGQLTEHSKWTPLQGRIETALKRTLIPIFGGGAIEVQKNIVALAGLGMPRG
jgi:alkylation response protein AidB-like acyl-CoA dehydrogenase